MLGIDISYWQKNNYKRLIDTYAEFVIARASFSTTVDQTCDPIFQYAKSKGKKLGIYFFPLTSDGTPEWSAEWCYNQVLGYIGHAIFCLDWEDYWEAHRGHNVGDTIWALRWLKKFERLSGVKPLIYMNSSTEKSYDWSLVRANGNGLWLANYGVNNGKENPFPDPKHWDIVAIHQFTSRGDNSNPLDRDRFFGDGKAWDAYARVNKKMPVTPPKPSNTQDSPKDVSGTVNDVKPAQKPEETPKTTPTEAKETVQKEEDKKTTTKDNYEKIIKEKDKKMEDYKNIIGEITTDFEFSEKTKKIVYLVGDGIIISGIIAPIFATALCAKDATAFATALSQLLITLGTGLLFTFKLLKKKS